MEEDSKIIEKLLHNYAKIVGHEEGFNNGIKEGIMGGIKTWEYNNSLEIAKKMLNSNIDIDTIINITNLKREEIEKLMWYSQNLFDYIF